MSNKVLEHIAQKYDSVRKGVKAVMGGRVLEYEAKTIKNEGIKEGMEKGIEKGIEKGRQENKRMVALAMLADKQLSLEKIAEYTGLSMEEVQHLKDGKTA